MIKFDLEGVNTLKAVDTADIDSVVLYLNVLHTWVDGEAVCTLHTIDKSWVEDEVCWDFPIKGEDWNLYPITSLDDSFDLMKGGDIGYDPIGYSDMGKIGEWQSSNITETMKEYLHAPEKNNGIMMRSGAELQPHKFYSSETSDTKLRPKLVFYTEGTSIITNKNVSINNSLRVEAAGNQCRVFVGEDSDYRLTICNLMGREFFAYEGTESGWIDIPLRNISDAVFIARLESGGKTSTMHFIHK